MLLPAIREKTSQTLRSHKIIFSVFLVLVLIITAEGFYYFLVFKNRDKELRIEKKGIYTHVYSEEMGIDKFISGEITAVSDGGLFSLKVENSNKVIWVSLNQDARLFTWQEGGSQAYHLEEVNLSVGDQVFVAGISEVGGGRIEASRVTILK